MLSFPAPAEPENEQSHTLKSLKNVRFLYDRQNVQIRGRRKMWARGGIKMSSLSDVRLKVIISCDVELKVNISCDVELQVTITCDVGHKVKISRDAALKISVQRPCAR